MATRSSFSSEIDSESIDEREILDDIWCVTGLPGDDFSVDDFFNLPIEETVENGGLFLEEEEDEEKYSNSSDSHDPAADSAHFSTHLAIPDDDMQELELWSAFMDDSVPEPTLACPKPIMDAYNKKTGFTFLNRIEQRIVRASFFPTVVPVKPRSKRSRTIGNRTWYTGSPLKTELAFLSSPSSPVSTLLFAPPVHEMGVFYDVDKRPVKKTKMKPLSSLSGEIGLNSPVQRCSHCQVTKTPQWRAGPDGPKTLCNACGVRFKSGRLFPEYRPACSPKFCSEVHSNSHRKVIEMRLRKETPELFTGSVQPLSSS